MQFRAETQSIPTDVSASILCIQLWFYLIYNTWNMIVSYRYNVTHTLSVCVSVWVLIVWKNGTTIADDKSTNTYKKMWQTHAVFHYKFICFLYWISFVYYTFIISAYELSYSSIVRSLISILDSWWDLVEKCILYNTYTDCHDFVEIVSHPDDTK